MDFWPIDGDKKWFSSWAWFVPTEKVSLSAGPSLTVSLFKAGRFIYFLLVLLLVFFGFFCICFSSEYYQSRDLALLVLSQVLLFVFPEFMMLWNSFFGFMSSGLLQFWDKHKLTIIRLVLCFFLCTCVSDFSLKVDLILQVTLFWIPLPSKTVTPRSKLKLYFSNQQLHGFTTFFFLRCSNCHVSKTQICSEIFIKHWHCCLINLM